MLLAKDGIKRNDSLLLLSIIYGNIHTKIPKMWHKPSCRCYRLTCLSSQLKLVNHPRYINKKLESRAKFRLFEALSTSDLVFPHLVRFLSTPFIILHLWFLDQSPKFGVISNNLVIFYLIICSPLSHWG